MKPEPEDRSVHTERPGGLPIVRLVLAALAVAAVAYGLLSGPEQAPIADSPAPRLPVEPAPPPQPELPPAPDIPAAAIEPVPRPDPGPAAAPPAAPAPPPPAMDTSDAELRQRLGDSTQGTPLAGTLGTDNLVERTTAAIDLLSRGGLMYKLLPLPRPTGRFPVIERGGQVLLDPDGFQRYDDYARTIEAFDTAMLVATFHRFRPLLEATYDGLGYRAEDFDNALIRALDRILAAPPLVGDVPLVKKEAIYQYADPALEQRSDLDKQLMRMGPENLARVQNQARRLRAALLAGG